MPAARFLHSAEHCSPLAMTVTARRVAPCSASARALVLVAVLSACSREPVAPSGAAPLLQRQAPRAEVSSVVAVGVLLDSFAIGGVYAVQPRGGYFGGSSYARSPEKEQYAGTIRGHPTGIVLPVGLPVRVLAEGSVTSHSTPAWQTGYCVPYGATDPWCAISAWTYSIHGLVPGPGVERPYEPGMGLTLAWSRVGVQTVVFYAQFPLAQFFRGRVPAADTALARELHFWRNGCCYYIPWGTTAAWETYEGHWRFGAVPDDGGQAELGVPAVLHLSGPRTDAPTAAAADFTVGTTTGDSIMATRWWFVRPANNAFDGEPLPLAPTGVPFPPLFPRYPDAQRSLFSEIVSCAGRTTCAYQAAAPGAVVVQATLADGRVLAARNTGRSGAHVKITADSTTLTHGDTTVFRVTAPGAIQLTITGYQFVPVAAGSSSAVVAVHQTMALRASRTAVARNTGSTSSSPRSSVRQGTPAVATASTTAVPVRKRMQFRDAAFECGDATVAVCYDDPLQTGYEVVTAIVDGEVQRDSVLVRVLPALKLTCSDRNGVSDANGGTTVVRADTVSCKASATEGLLAVTNWSFASSGYPYSLMRSGGDDSTYARDSSTWKGPMLTAGRVTVGAKVGGVDQTASAQVLVNARPWNTRWIDSTRWIVKEVPHPYTDPPAADSELGLNGQSALRDYLSSYMKVEQGPNQGLLAFTRFPVKLYFEVSVHYAAMRTGSIFYGMQPRLATGNYCAATTMVNSLPLVKKHEGFVPVDTIRPKLSHTFNYKYWFRQTLNDSVETLVDKDMDSLGVRIERLRVRGHSVAVDSSKAITHRQGSNPFTLNCRFNYDPAVRF